MAQLTFNIPAAALSRLDAYAQELRYVDFHDYAVNWMKEQVKYLRQRDNADQAKALVNTEPPPVVIT